MKLKTTFLFCALALFATAQNVTFTDTIFRNALLAHGNTITGPNISNIDANNDGAIQISEAQSYTETIDVRNLNISDLTGIEEFTSATRLYCFGNSLTSLDVSQNDSLISLLCYNNNIDSLNVTQNPDLVRLECYQNPLNSLDVSNNTALTWLACHNNTLTSLDLSQNPLISRLHCDNNSLTTLDVSHMNNLTWLYCHHNNLTSLDVSQNTSLYWLLCGYNSLTSLNISQNIALDELHCQYNSLITLDASQNTALTKFNCRNNSLQSLNVANGNNGNTSSSLSYMRVQNNPNLSCIQHDTGFDPTTAGSWQKDATASWSEDCGCMITSSTDVQEHYCSDFTWIDGITYTQDTTGVQDTLINIAGCDSIVTLNLTILQSISTYDIQEHCESFTWIDGNTYTQDTTGVQDTLVNAAGCDSIVTLNLTINTPPTVSISESNGTLIFSGADSVEWYFNGALIPSENGDSLVLENLGENNGDYYAVGYSTSNCADTSNTVSMVGLNVAENSWSNFTMYPNPTTGTVEIQSNSTVEKIEIINNLGQKIGAFKQSQFDISNLKNGIYFVKITTKIGTSTKRLIKQ